MNLDAKEFAVTNVGLAPDDFKAIDADHNGMIFENEWLTFMSLYQVVTDNRVTLTIGTAATGPFAQIDTNGDGRLTHGEWFPRWRRSEQWDANHDGEITLDELPRRLVGTFHLGTMHSAQIPPAMNEAQTPAAAAEASPAWFQKMDRNRDGEVSLREFLARSRSFAASTPTMTATSTPTKPAAQLAKRAATRSDRRQNRIPGSA